MDNDDKNIQKPASESVVTLTKVSHRYANNRVLDNISISLPAGKMVGFIGPDGVGKSSLLALIAGARAIQELSLIHI